MRNDTQHEAQAKNQTRKSLFTLVLLILVITFQFSQTVSAEYGTTTMQVTAVVKASCKLDAKNVQFGVYDPVTANSQTDLSTTSDINLKCSRGSTARITIDAGMNYGKAATHSRAMASNEGGSYLAYELYKDQNGQEIWDTQTPLIRYADSTEPMNVKVHAKIPGNQQVDDGIYSDTLTLSVAY